MREAHIAFHTADRFLEQVARGAAAVVHRVMASRVFVDIAVILAALADVLIGNYDRGVVEYAASLLAVAALLIRRRLPTVACVLTMPGLFIGSAVVAPMLALYTLAKHTPRLWLLSVAAIAMFFGYGGYITAPSDTFPGSILRALYTSVYALGPLALGTLARIRGELKQRIDELGRSRAAEYRQAALAVEAREHAAADAAVARERAQIAREMHDVVAHQVSLIAVQAGAMKMAAPDELTRGFAATVRELCVSTLVELREMVGVLRASGGSSSDAYPQPTLHDLPYLVAASGLHVSSDIALPDDLPAPVQRSVYRFVQEALTNARKHAPDSTVTLSADVDETRIVVTVENGRPSRPPLPLPSSGFGLIGLRERAELLGGTIETTRADDGGFLIRMMLPASR